MDDDHRPKREREFYLRLLGLSRAEEVEPLLQAALQIVLEVSGAERAYLRLGDEGSEVPHPASIAHGCTTADLRSMEEQISQGIVAEALAVGRTIRTMSAMLDARFKDRGSVRQREIEAVLCVPFGSPRPGGVVYLQGRKGGALFDDDVVQMVETLAEQVGLLSHRLLALAAARDADDPTRELRIHLGADDIIGRSRALATVLGQVAHAARLDTMKVLLTGPSGTGKTALAQLIAKNSRRPSGAFQNLNCAALTDSLFEAELFGVRAGAHSTAHTDQTGKVEAAEGGTLFLDEIAELSPGGQSKLLQFLQSGTYHRVGDPALRTADVRVIAATNVDLEERVRAGSFREDLFYRLDVVRIAVPALAQRTEDIPELVQYFLRRAVERERIPPLFASPGALKAACVAAWPGNVRQLENFCNKAIVRALSQGAAAVEAAHLLPDQADGDGPLTLQAGALRFQGQFVEQALRRNGWNVARTAREIDVTRSHMYNLIQTHGLKRPN